MGISDDGVDRVESAEGGDGAAIELGVIQTKNDPLSRLEHGLLNVDQQGVGVGDTVECDAASAHYCNIGVHSGQRLDSERADQHTESRVNHPTGDQHLDAVVGAEMVGHR